MLTPSYVTLEHQYKADENGVLFVPWYQIERPISGREILDHKLMHVPYPVPTKVNVLPHLDLDCDIWYHVINLVRTYVSKAPTVIPVIDLDTYMEVYDEPFTNLDTPTNFDSVIVLDSDGDTVLFNKGNVGKIVTKEPWVEGLKVDDVVLRFDVEHL